MPDYKWNDDMFTKMIKEDADKIIKISDEVRECLEKQLYNDEKVNLLCDQVENSKKKLALKADDILISTGASTTIGAPIVVSAADDSANTSDGASAPKELDNNNTDSKKKKNNKIDSISDAKVNKSQAKHMLNTFGRQKWDELKEQFGNNISKMVTEFIQNGPGLMDFALFDGIYGVITKPLSDEFSKDMLKFYEEQKTFATSYNVLMKAFSTSNDNMSTLLDNIAEDISEADDADSMDKDRLNVFIAAVKLVTAIIHNNVLRPRIKKAFENSTNNPRIYDALVKFYKAIDDIDNKKARNAAGELNFIGLKRVAKSIYPNTVAARNLNGTNAIAAMFLIISSAISKGRMEMEYNISEAHEEYNRNHNKLDASYIKYDSLASEAFDNGRSPNPAIIDDASVGPIPYKLMIDKDRIALMQGDDNKAIFRTSKKDWDNAINKIVKEHNVNSNDYKIVMSLLNIVKNSKDSGTIRNELAKLLKNYSFIQDNSFAKNYAPKNN